jgi:uncharacterized HAD superfamily protein
MIRYAVDIDGVLFDSNGAMLGAINARFGTRHAIADIIAYGWREWCGHEQAHHAYSAFADLITAGMAWLPDAVDGLHHLAAAGGASIITHRTPDLAAVTAVALAGLPWHSIHHVDQRLAKAETALSLGCTVALEDNPAQALAYAEAGLSVYLFSYPYNAAVRHPLVRPVAGWAGVLAAEGLLAALGASRAGTLLP